MKTFFIAVLSLWLGSVVALAQSITVSGSDLAKEYAHDGYAAQTKYAGKIITITGTIDSMDTSSFGTSQVQLVGGARLSIADNQSDNMGQLQKGAMIVANCTVGDGSSLPLLTACELPGTAEPHHFLRRYY